jgi:nucleoid-associated protein YgaU
MGGENMFSKLVRYVLVAAIGVSIAAPCAFAQTSSPTTEQLVQQVQALRQEVAGMRQEVFEIRNIAVDSRLEAEMFKEETLYRLGLWRARLGEGMSLSIAAQDAAARAEAAAAKAQDHISTLLQRVSLVEGTCSAMAKDITALKKEVAEVRCIAETADACCKRAMNQLADLSSRTKALETDVAMAKEMAATAKVQADQARQEVRQLSTQVKQNRDLFLGKVEQTLQDMKQEQATKSPKIQPKTVPAQQMYEVQKGDSLWIIAKKVYNDSTQWRKIFEANKDRLVNPNSLYPGQHLIIP